MEFIKGITFAPFVGKGVLGTDDAKRSLCLLKENTGANFVLFVPTGIQEHAQSETICYTSDATPTDDELADIIEYAHEIGLKAGIKPTVNCKDGTWRAFINFFDKDVPCEPKWGNWFAAYTDFQLHYAELAKETGCEMFIAGCEMVMSERREKEWRALIGRVKAVYPGPVSYNTDKYQEDNVKWWDCVDIISSSGYYPISDWEAQLDRIEAVVKAFDKPFFFAECGCMSVMGSSRVPNDWTMPGDAAPKEQADWYKAMFEACKKREWVGGFCLWDWGARKYPVEEAAQDRSYDIYAKPAEAVVREYYGKLKMDIHSLSSQYFVRTLTEQDVNAIYELSVGNPLFYQYCPPYVTRESILSDMRALPPKMTYEDKYYIGFWDKQRLIAVMDLITNYPDKETVFIGLFMMDKLVQGIGTGSSVIEECASYFKSEGYSFIRLAYAKGNPQSERFWRKNGFVDTGIERQLDGYIAVVLQKKL